MGKPLGWREGVLPCLVLCFGSCRQDPCPVKDVQLSQDPGNWQEFWGAGLLGNSFLPMWGGHEASHSPHPEVSSLVKAAHLKNRWCLKTFWGWWWRGGCFCTCDQLTTSTQKALVLEMTWLTFPLLLLGSFSYWIIYEHQGCLTVGPQQKWKLRINGLPSLVWYQASLLLYFQISSASDKKAITCYLLLGKKISTKPTYISLYFYALCLFNLGHLYSSFWRLGRGMVDLPSPALGSFVLGATQSQWWRTPSLLTRSDFLLSDFQGNFWMADIFIRLRALKEFKGIFVCNNTHRALCVFLWWTGSVWRAQVETTSLQPVQVGGEALAWCQAGLALHPCHTQETGALFTLSWSWAELGLGQCEGLWHVCQSALTEPCVKPPPPQAPLYQVQSSIKSSHDSTGGGCPVCYSRTAHPRSETWFSCQGALMPWAVPLKRPLPEPIICQGWASSQPCAFCTPDGSLGAAPLFQPNREKE